MSADAPSAGRLPQNIADHSRLMYLDAVLGFQNFVGPVLVIFYMQYMGLSFSQYCFLDSLFFIMVAVLEVPSGHIADFFGRKRMYLIAQTVVLLSMLLLLAVPSFTGALVSILLMGIAAPMASGNTSAIYYESFAEAGKTRELQELFSKTGSVAFVSSTIACLCAGYLAKAHLALPLAVDCALLLGSILATARYLHDAGTYKPDAARFCSDTVSSLRPGRFKEYVKVIKRHKRLIVFFSISSMVFAILRGSYSFYQPLMKGAGIDLGKIGILFAVFNLVSAAASYYSKRFTDRAGHEKRILLILLAAVAASFAGIALAPGMAAVAFILLQQVIRGANAPYFSIRKNEYIPANSKSRVMLLSVANMFGTLFTSGAIMLLSFLTTLAGLKSSILMFGAVLCAVLGAFIALHVRWESARRAETGAESLEAA